MEEYKVIPDEPLVKIENEVAELKDYLKELGNKKEKLKDKESKVVSNLKDLENDLSSKVHTSKEDLFKEMLKYARVNQEIINTIVVSNLELQTKLSETIVSLNELTKEIKRLIHIFKEAAMQYLVEGEGEEKTTEKKKEVVGEDRLSILEKQNNRIIELLSKIQKALEESKSTERKPVVPPGIPPQMPMYPMPRR